LKILVRVDLETEYLYWIYKKMFKYQEQPCIAYVINDFTSSKIEEKSKALEQVS